MLDDITIQETMKSFGSEAEKYHKYRSTYPPEFYDKIFSLANGDVKRVLDLACGTGMSTEKLVRESVEIFGCDFDKRMLEKAKNNSLNNSFGIHYKFGKAEDLPFEDDYFDIVSIGNAFHWFANEKSVKEIRRVLRKGGLFFAYWKHLDEKDVAIRNDIFSQFNPSYKITGKLILFEECKNLLNKMNFRDINHLSQKYSFNYSLGDAVGRLKTIGGYFKLTNEDKSSFDDVAKNVLLKYFPSGDVSFLSTTHICYAYK